LMFSKIVFSEKGRVKPTIMVLLNGREVSSFDPEKIKIKEGGEIVFIPLIHGG
jgi:molybdopterin converting factor small subunit